MIPKCLKVDKLSFYVKPIFPLVNREIRMHSEEIYQSREESILE